MYAASVKGGLEAYLVSGDVFAFVRCIQWFLDGFSSKEVSQKRVYTCRLAIRMCVKKCLLNTDLKIYFLNKKPIDNNNLAMIKQIK